MTVMTEAQRIYKELKQDIVTCKLAPGLSISELEMCKRYDASRTPVREACRRLGNESLMQMVPFRGYSITPLTIEEYRNLHDASDSCFVVWILSSAVTYNGPHTSIAQTRLLQMRHILTYPPT